MDHFIWEWIDQWGRIVVYGVGQGGGTPIYKTTILGTEKHIAEIFVFGRFLPRLSGPRHSRVISKASFCWVHFTLHYKILTQKFTNFEVRTEPLCGYTLTAGLELI